MSFINTSFWEINKVWLQIQLQTQTTTSIKKINMTLCRLHLAYRASTFLVSHFFFFFFFFFSARMNNNCTVHADGFTMRETKCTVHGTYNHFVQKKNIKNGYRGTIHSFKNYFATVFLVFNFQQNKLYPNKHQIFRKSNH